MNLGMLDLAMSTRNMREQMTFDRRYIDMMVPHHQAAVEMAEIALERSKRPEIRELAQNIIRSQSEEIAQMKAWRKAWYGSDRTPPLSQMPMIMEGMQMMNDVPMDMQGDLEVLKRFPGYFDRAFIDGVSTSPRRQAIVGKVVGLAQRRTRPGTWFHGACVVHWDPTPLLAALALAPQDREAAAAELAASVTGVADAAVRRSSPSPKTTTKTPRQPLPEQVELYMTKR